MFRKEIFPLPRWMRIALRICYLGRVPKPSEAEFYRRLHTGNPGDLEFYLKASDGARNILELGCGWGRLSLPLLAAGYAVTGIDIETHFIEEAKLSLELFPKGQFLRGDARSFNLASASRPSLFDRIYLAYNTLYSLGGPKGVLSCFKQAKEHLSPEGELWLDFYPMDSLHAALLAGEEAGEDDKEPVAVQDWDGNTVSVYETSQLDPSAQVVEVLYIASDERQVELARLPMRHSYLLFDQVTSLLHEAGFMLIGGFGSFEGALLDEDAEQLILGVRHLEDSPHDSELI